MPNLYNKTKFHISVNDIDHLPEDSEVEIAFAGRSNAGKSSALNTLTMQNNLARVSKTPGRTQLINYFKLPQDGAYLVDLPGYGYAKVPEAVRKHWEKLLGDYLLYREQLKGIVLIMDIRHPLKIQDIRFLDCCQARGLPAHILLTKSDKLSKNEQNKQLFAVEKQLGTYSFPLSIQLFSSLKKQGLEALAYQLTQWTGIGIN